MAGNCGGATTTTTPLLPDVAALEKNSGGERPKEPWKGELVKSIVYAGLDAIITSFSLISSISAGRLSSAGRGGKGADGDEVGGHEPPKEPRTIVTPAVVNIFAKYGDIMVDEKMVQNGILSPDDGEKPWKKGLITFGAFLVFGSFPILAFIILIPFTRNDTHKFIGACILSALALAILGIAKAKIAGQNYWVSVGGTLFNGALAGFAAYGIGWLLRDVAGLED
ncbi:protein of unknown function DUF125, transmembrane [Cynara cardunculus var. scolymus]|uniref:Vacuolar iron transporter n=1 Tax=Cynara cardunculus var. scolymus TaxID=59895 RepID=A0A103XEA8_CYNCS|nr:protein of unknown function DUF125, transmembrane [Cynara cardunculus var. scolymus]